MRQSKPGLSWRSLALPTATEVAATEVWRAICRRLSALWKLSSLPAQPRCTEDREWDGRALIADLWDLRSQLSGFRAVDAMPEASWEAAMALLEETATGEIAEDDHAG